MAADKVFCSPLSLPLKNWLGSQGCQTASCNLNHCSVFQSCRKRFKYRFYHHFQSTASGSLYFAESSSRSRKSISNRSGIACPANSRASLLFRTAANLFDWCTSLGRPKRATFEIEGERASFEFTSSLISFALGVIFLVLFQILGFLSF